jgi:hypothetical protein
MNEKDYVITRDIFPTLKYRYKLPMDRHVRKEIESIEEQFLLAISPILSSNFNVVILEYEDLNNGMKQLLKQECLFKINMDDTNFLDLCDFSYSVTRRTNPDNQADCSSGPRYGCLPLDTQVKILIAKCANKSIALVDIGAFSGTTLKNEANRLYNSGINVKRIYLSVGSAHGKKNIENIREGLEVIIQHSFEFGEWVQSRDFLCIDGRMPNISLDNNGFPLLLYSDHLESWASIPPQNVMCVKNYISEYFNKLKEVLHKHQIDMSLTPIRKNVDNTYAHILSFS